ncbi:hypothetical protein O7622_02300 [Micromonospora sp. WMMD1076]|nr:hypothetical protein [Micromonospora sp. WMMD1076]WFF07455.1 hypothetical protein O7622_02300 [Micromonospora sp. WMMD1076]
MSERTERSEGRERMPSRHSMSERTERSEGRERMPSRHSMSERTERIGRLSYRTGRIGGGERSGPTA